MMFKKVIPMKKALLLFLLASSAVAFDYLGYAEATYSATGYIPRGYAFIHVPYSDVMQDAEQITHNNVFFDDTGAFINATGNYNYTVVLKINAFKTQILSDPPFPINSFGNYSLPTKFIDSDDLRIIQKSKELTTNVSSELEAISGITEWVHENVMYNMSLAGKPRMKASEVLSVRQGVCVDYSSLTAALLRASGIPARYAEGYYLLSDGSAEPHAWVEAYVPGSGWLPVDPANGVTASANLLKESSGSDPSELVDTVFYEGNGEENATSEKKVLVSRQEAFPKILAEVMVIDSEVGFGSVAGVNVYLKNDRSSFFISDLRVGASEGVSPDYVFDAVVLPPSSETMKEFLFVMPSNLSQRREYFFPVRFSGPGFDEKASISVKPSADVIKRSNLQIKSTEVSVFQRNFLISVELENSGNVEAPVRIVVSGPAGSSSRGVVIQGGQSKTEEFAFQLGKNDSQLNYSITVYSGEEVMSKKLPVILKREAQRESQPHSFSNIFIVSFIIITSLALAALVYPRQTKKLRTGVFKKRLEKHEIRRSLEFLEREEKKHHGIEEMLRKKHRRR
ncbi:MAG: transglutaminase-like domain-containing protein [archaeon]